MKLSLKNLFKTLFVTSHTINLIPSVIQRIQAIFLVSEIKFVIQFKFQEKFDRILDSTASFSDTNSSRLVT